MPETTKQTQLFRFDQMAVQVKDKVEPEEADVDRYVGLEHIDPESLKIRRWGEPSDVESSKILFRSGDIIFGKRRAYQRKLAVADFDGICSAHAMVLRPKTDVVLEEFLPFFMQSDIFMDRAVKISVGGLSPTINWRDLAKEEFALPPLEEQRRIAEVLQAANSSLESLLRLELRLTELFSSLLEELLSNGLEGSSNQKVNGIQYPANWPMQPLSELASVERGKFSHRPRNLPEFFGGPYPFVQTGDIAASTGDLDEASQSLSEEGVQYSRSFPPGAILITIAAIIGETAITNCETWAPDSVVGITPSEAIDVRFLEYVLRRLQPQLDGELATKSTQKNINLGILKPLQIPCPDIGTQRDICLQLRRVENGLSEVNARILTLRHLNLRILQSALPRDQA
jgi:type I restriction enzyme, S subunit